MGTRTTKTFKKTVPAEGSKSRKWIMLLGFIVAVPAAVWLMKPDAPDRETAGRAAAGMAESVQETVAGGGATAPPAPAARPKTLDVEERVKSLRQQLARELDDPWAAELFGLGGDNSFAAVSAASERMFDRGAEEDVAALFRYLETPLTAALNEHEWQAMQRRIVDYLVMEWPQRERAQEKLLALFENPQTELSVRSAVARRLDKLYLQSSAPEAITETLWNSVTAPANDITSASLAALARISATADTVDQDKLRDTATEIVSNGRASLTARVTAMGVATWLESPAIYSQAQTLINEGDQPEVLQLAAIATIMKFGDSSNIEALEQLAENRPYPVNKAATEAIKHLSGR